MILMEGLTRLQFLTHPLHLPLPSTHPYNVPSVNYSHFEKVAQNPAVLATH